MSDIKMTYITLGQNCWGKASDQDDSFYRCLDNWPESYSPDPALFITFHVSTETYVNGFGGFNMPGDHPDEVKVMTLKVPKKTIQAFKRAQDELKFGEGCEIDYHDS